MVDSKFIRCGECEIGADVFDIVCDISSGDCVLRDDVNGDFVISEVTTLNPLFMSEKACEKIRTDLGVDGIIATDKYLYTIAGDTVSAREYSDTSKAVASFPFNYDVQYEGDIDE